MYVGQDRSTDLTPHFREDVQTAVDPWTTRRLPGAAIGLVIGGLEDVRQRKPGTDLLHLSGNLDAQIQRLRSARAGDQEQWLIESGFEVAELHTFAR
jgi:branched-subunit amino acid aminotransferase/4-amino-4-deoxychorismate lyase